jgi:hypothetical protein
MSEHRRDILEMLGQGKITPDEAERLIAAIEKAPHEEHTASAGSSPPKYLRVVVDGEQGASGDTLTKVNIRVPLQLLRAGVRLAGLIPKDKQDRVNAALREKGVAFDISQLKPENLEELLAQLNDMSVDVDGARGQKKVKIFCE